MLCMFYRAFSYHLSVLLFITYIKHTYSSISKSSSYLFEPEIGNFKNQHQCCLFWADNTETIIREKVQRLFHIILLIWTARESSNTWIGKFLTEEKKTFHVFKSICRSFNIQSRPGKKQQWTMPTQLCHRQSSHREHIRGLAKFLQHV